MTVILFIITRLTNAFLILFFKVTDVFKGSTCINDALYCRGKARHCDSKYSNVLDAFLLLSP